MQKIDIAIAKGDGVGPEIMQATLAILQGAGAPIITHEIEVGEKVYLRGFPTGIDPKSWEIIHSTQAFLKAPITTPQGGGFRSLNVTIRGALGLYANIRPCISYHPFVATKHPGMDVVIIRENEEDLYTGIEYRQTQESYHALKIISKGGCERIVRYAFEYARANGRKKVTCFTKDNIMKMTDGLFHSVYDAIGTEYPDIEKEHWIIDIGAAKLADTPDRFDVIVMANLYGDILSDVAAQIAGSVGLAGSANIGIHGAMFEAIHGSAPRRANQNMANPSGLLLAAVMMLDHCGLADTAALIYNAWLTALEDGIHTYDIYNKEISKQQVGTQEFAQAVIARLGKKPTLLPQKQASKKTSPHITTSQSTPLPKTLRGIDIYIESRQNIAEIKQLADQCLKNLPMRLSMITNRGATLYPSAFVTPHHSDEWRIRYVSAEKGPISPEIGLELQRRYIEHNTPATKTENLYYFGDTPGFSVTQEEQ